MDKKLIELQIYAVAGTPSDPDRSMVLLKEKDGERILPMMMSTKRAVTLMMRTKVQLPMPVATTIPDAAILMMNKFDVHLTRVVLTAIKEGNFYCQIYAEREGEEKTLEFCPAIDGIVLATAARCSLMIEEELLEAQYMHKTGENAFAININMLTRQMLEEALQHAVESEHYEAASRLRDELAKRPAE